jgi:hypothetical protein
MKSELRFKAVSPFVCGFRIIDQKPAWRTDKKNKPLSGTIQKATMKRILFAVIGISALAGFGAYWRQTRQASATSTETATETPAQTATVPDNPQPTENGAPPVAQTELSAVTVERPRGANVAGGEAEPALDGVNVNRTVDLLVSPLVTVGQKRETWHQLRQSGQLERVITELEQRLAQDPRAAAYPAELGQAYLQKCATLDDMREKGILAMQADKLFETALNLDPGNWEARFTKAMAMSYWPPILNKGEEVIQQFQTLIQQQEAEAPQPHFADTYAWLGDQYQKTGRGDDARAVWQRGAALFPEDSNLRKKLAASEQVVN